MSTGIIIIIIAVRIAKLDTCIAELGLVLGPEYAGQKLAPVWKTAKESAEEVKASIKKCERMAAGRED